MPPPQRGVYTLTFYDAAGDQIAVAINSRGRCIAWLPFTAGTRAQTEETLTRLLDVADPVPLLRAI